MLKRLIITLLVLNAAPLHALTLGQIHVDSFINQPLKATIDIEDVKGNELSALKVRLAPRVDFRNAGVEWHSHLEELRFALIQTNRGPAIRVTSRAAVKEPFLSFVIDANWAKGKIAKDYTLLLDPPLYTGASAAPVEMADAGSLSAKRQAPLPQQQQSAPQPQAQPLPVESPVAASPSTARTMTGSSLWAVASKVRPQAATMQQTMVAIQEENPDAFMRGNMNLLKKGEMLRIPSAEVIAGIPRRAAVNRVARHQQAMRSGKVLAPAERLSPEIVTLAQSTQPQEGAADPAAAAAESVGRLRLESAADVVDEELLAGGSGAQNGELAADTPVVDENRALRSRVKVLEEQLRVARKLIQMKGELAQLQQLYRQLDEQNTQADQEMLALAERQLLADAEAAAAGADVAPPVGTLESDVEAPLAEQQAREAGTDVADGSDKADSAATLTAEEKSLLSLAPEIDTDASAEEPETAMQNAAEPPGTIAVVAATEDSALSSTLQQAGGEAQSSLAETPAAVEPPAEKQAQEQAAEEDAVRRDSLIEGVDNNLLFAIGGVALVGLLLALLLGRLGKTRGARDSETMEMQLVGETVAEAPVESGSNDYRGASAHATRAVSDFGADTAQQDLAASPLDASSTGDSLPPHSNPPGKEPESLDALDFANALVRSGERAQAREVLVQAIEADPQRADTNMRLMELLHADKDRHAYEARMQGMQRHGFDDDAKLWQKIERMHADLLPAGVGSLGIVNQQKARAEVIDLHADDNVGPAQKQHRLIIDDEDEAASSAHHDADLENALRAFEQQLEKSKSTSDELLAEAGEALDDAAEILHNPITSAIPDARIVDNLELDEELQIDESRDDGEQAEVITLDDSFGIDSHIKDEFDYLMTRSSAAGAGERQFQEDMHRADTRAATPGGTHSVTSFAAEPASLKQAEADAKIDLAAAFAEMGDHDGARDILAEVIAEGSARQRQAAEEMLKKFS